MEFDAQQLAGRIARLAPDQRAAFLHALVAKGLPLDRLPIVAAPRAATLPLSSAQQRLWFLWQLEPDSAAYHMAAALRLRGALDTAALEHSLHTLHHRHEALRTRFRAHPSQDAEQLIDPAAPLPLVQIDLSHLPASEREPALRARIETEANTPFDLSQGAWRWTLIRLAADEHALLLTAHHIVADAWSFGLLTRELAACYHAAVHGRPAELPPLTIQYADYAVWQHSGLAEASQAQDLAYWRAQLGDDPPVLTLPADRPAPKQPSGRGGRHRLRLDAELSEGLGRLARAHGSTRFAVLLAAYAALLYRLSGQTDLRIGVPVANRTRVETEGVVGCFVNTLVLRVELDGRLPFPALLARVHAANRDAQAHQGLPFERLVAELQPERDLAHAPLFQVLFNLIDDQGPRLPALHGLTLEAIERDQTGAQFDLSLDLSDQGGQLDASFTYRRDRFDATTIVRYAEAYAELLRAVLAAPDRRLAELPLEPASARAQRLAVSQAEMTLQPWPALVPARFAVQAARTPHAIALVLDDRQLSYAELNRRANRLAHRLLALDFGPEARLGLLLPRGLDMVTAILAALKAGLTFVPLDPDYPADRLAYMIDDAAIRLLLVTPATAGRAGGQPVLDLGADPTGPEHDPAVPLHPAQLAYLMYTSGSTGRPKGVAIDQRALAGHTEVAREFFALTPEDRVLQFSTFNFDGFVDQLFPALVTGATVVLRGPELWDSREFLHRLHRHSITVADLATAYWFQLAQDFAQEPAADYGALRLVSATGEAMPPEGINAWRAAGLGHVRLLNTYGPTEATVTASVQDCSALVAGAEPLPLQMAIGHALPGRAFYLLDRDGEPTLPGVPGELCIGGELLARGYHGRPALSADRFVPDPFGPPGARLYRTGDLARQLADGRYEYLGRIDQQVKLRGFRIELGEIEARLQSHPQVRQALALVREDRPGDRRLVAYVVPHGEAPTAEALRRHLTETLPDYMLPAALVSLAALPQSPNGKLDRRALPVPDYGPDPATGTAPRDAREQALAAIWQDVLGLAQVGIHDAFFALGGHSLLATRVIAQIRRRLGVELPLRALFEAPTIADLAARLPDRAAPAPDAIPVLADRDRALPLSYAQQGLWFVQQLDPDSAAYHIPSAARLHGPLDVAALAQAFQALVQRHEALRTGFPLEQGEPVQRIAATVELPLAVLDLAALAEPEREAAAQAHLLAEARRPFDLTRPPLLRLTLIRLAPEQHLLLVVLHHLVADGWSMGLLVRELAECYAAAHAGRPATLPPQPIQYADYAVWQRQRLAGDGLARQLAYWRQALGTLQPPLDLPSDRPRPAAMSGHGGRHDFRLGADPAQALQRLCQQEGATLFMALLGAVQIWLHAHTGRPDPIVGTDIANRARAETEGVVGFFLNQLALRADLGGNPSFRARLARLRPQLLEAYAHQDLPFDKLVEALNPVRSLAHTPLFQIKLVLQNQAEAALALPGLRVTPEPLAHSQAQLDLHLTIEEDADGLAGTLKYSADLFDPDTAAGFADDLVALLTAIAEQPDQDLARLAAGVTERARQRRQDAQRARQDQGLARLGRVRRQSLLTPASLEGTTP